MSGGKVTSPIRPLSRAILQIVCACAIPAVLVAMAAIYYHYSTMREDIVASSVRRTTAAAAHIDSVLSGVQIGLFTLSESAHLDSGDLRRFHAQAKNVVAYLNVAQSIYIVDRTGQQLANTLRPFGTVLPKSANQDFVERIVRDRKPHVSDLFVGAVSKKPMVAIGVPVLKNGEVVAVLAATINPDVLSEILVRQYLPVDWVISIQDSTGRFVARSRQIDRFIGQPAAPDLVRALSSKKSGTLQGVTKDGIVVLAAYTHLRNSGWSLAVGIHKGKLLDELHWTIAAALVAVFLISAIGFSVAIRIADRMKREISGLVPLAEALSRAEPVHPYACRFGETNEVVRALQLASDRLCQSEHKAFHDPLTGLANRQMMHSILPRYQSLCIRNSSCLSLLYVDLDGFKAVNDTFGHQAGDEVLCAAASRMSGSTRRSDVCIRIGGDEFIVILPETDEVAARVIGQKLVDLLSAPIDTSAGVATISASIGVACLPGGVGMIEDLLAKGDAAMYEAKRAGKRQVSCSSPLEVIV